jgi:RNA-directed DNA polymerase
MDYVGAFPIAFIVAIAVIVLALWLGGRVGGPGRKRAGPGTRTRPGSTSGRRRERRRSRRQTKPRYGVDELARRLGMDEADLRAIRASYRYFTIPKRSGGDRLITAPDAATKQLQRRILRRVLARLPAHAAAHGFERGRSIVTNAVAHERAAVVLKLDVRDFFAATKASRVRRCYRVIGWDRESAKILTRLTTWDGGLPAGAPTSPRLANLVNVMLDARLAGLARREGATYTRYADDLTFSFAADDGAAVRRVIRVARRILWAERYELHLARKLQVRRRWERQLVTGLVVNHRARLPRDRRRWLRAVEHHAAVGRPTTISPEALAAWHGLELMVDSKAAELRAGAAATGGTLPDSGQ